MLLYTVLPSNLKPLNMNCAGAAALGVAVFAGALVPGALLAVSAVFSLDLFAGTDGDPGGVTCSTEVVPGSAALAVLEGAMGLAAAGLTLGGGSGGNCTQSLAADGAAAAGLVAAVSAGSDLGEIAGAGCKGVAVTGVRTGGLAGVSASPEVLVAAGAGGADGRFFLAGRAGK